jgi:threonine/homoserine/homoserine lactone efflux protein
MKKFLKIFWWGFIISFLGSLPLGTMNVTATKISIQNGAHEAFVFSVGTLVVEAACVYFVLLALQWVGKHQQLFRIFEWTTALLILILSVSCIIGAIEMKSFGNSVFTRSDLPPFVLGLLLSILNPLHVPFWFGWSTVLVTKNILIPQQKFFLFYIAGISLGTIAGFDVFIYGGNYIVQQLSDKHNVLNWVVGFVLLVTAMIQVYKIRKRSAASGQL